MNKFDAIIWRTNGVILLGALVLSILGGLAGLVISFIFNSDSSDNIFIEKK